MNSLVVFYEGLLLVIVNPKKLGQSTDAVLDWYAKEYAIQRDKLKGCWLAAVEQD